MRAAFLVIDVQKAFIKHMGQDKLDLMLEYINEVSEMFRKAKCPVVMIQDLEAGDGPGSRGFELVDGLHVHSEDYRVEKAFSNSFWKTGLEEYLKKEEIEFLVISGFAAEYCVLFTYNGADERGFKPVILQNGVAGISEVGEQSLITHRNLISFVAIEHMLG